jgi:hypothetical protein
VDEHESLSAEAGAGGPVGSLERRIKTLEREAGPLRGTLRLPDGREVSYERAEMLEALLAAIDGQDHRLLPYLRQIPTAVEMPGLVRALEGSE